MAFIRTIKQENPFSQIDRYVFESDNSISWKAKGLMGYLLTRPDNWKVNHKDLVNRAKESKNTVTAILKELEKAGYIHYYQLRNDNGKFEGWIYDVYERPEFNPNHKKRDIDILVNEENENVDLEPIEEKEQPKKPNPKNGDTEKRDTDNWDYNNNKGTNNKNNNNNLKTLDLRPIDDINNLQLPHSLKKWFGSKVDLLVKSKIDLYELEEFYNLCEFIKPNAEKDDVNFINDFEFSNLVKKLVSNVVINSSTQGVLLQWVHNKLHYKKSDVVIENEVEEIDFFNNHIADKLLNRTN